MNGSVSKTDTTVMDVVGFYRKINADIKVVENENSSNSRLKSANDVIVILSDEIILPRKKI